MKGQETFKIPVVPNTTNKSIRFPDDLIAKIDQVIIGKETNFSAFVIAAVRFALDHLEDVDGSGKEENK